MIKREREREREKKKEKEEASLQADLQNIEKEMGQMSKIGSCGCTLSNSIKIMRDTKRFVVLSFRY